MERHADAHPDPFGALPPGSVATITGDENVLLLVPGPGDESRDCGGLIARSCRRGRPPFVMVLGDGTDGGAGASERLAGRYARATRCAVGRLGLDDGRLLMAGLRGGIPDGGALFEVVVAAVIQVMWRTDCNVVCAPWAGASDPAAVATDRIAAAVAARSGVGRLCYVPRTPGRAGRPWAAGSRLEGWRLDAGDAAAADGVAMCEVYLKPPG
jgi:LmbE family N-acetylglucosaminyl deacetylase